VKLLGEYANELRDPENRKRYEEEIAKMEEERGNSVVFINPKPGYVLKTKDLNDGHKIFINICSDDNIGKPTSKAEKLSKTQGLQWSIPYSQAQPREDIDKGGEKCMVYDVIFHPDTLYLAGKDLRLREVVHGTALDALEKAFQVKCDRNNLKFPKMKFKGVFKPTVIRKSLDGDSKPNQISNPTMEEILPEIGNLKINKPDFSIKYRHMTDLQDHVTKQQSHVSSVRPKEMVVDINLPMLESAAGVDLDVQEKSLTLVREEPPKYNLHVDLPYPVDEERGSAKFDKSKKTLVVTLPIKPAPLLIAERLGSNDSGIEVDTGYRTKPSEDVQMEVNSVSESIIENECDNNLKEEFRTEVEESDAIVDDFLDEAVSYSYPSFTCSSLNNVITLTLEVKNVSADSFEKRIHSNPLSLAFKFSSIGSGYVPIHHAFAIQFLQEEAFNQDLIEVEFWDNNIVIQFPFNKSMTQGFRVGPSVLDLHQQVHNLDNFGQEPQETGSQKPNKKKKNKYQTEKHPKAMKTTKEEEAVVPEETSKKIRYCSGDSVDSSMSESPMETIHLEYPEDDFDEDEEMRTEDSCDEDIHLVQPPRYKRAISEDSQLGSKPMRGILKKKTFSVHGKGGRFRCYSESNMEDVGVSMTSSNDKLSFALSEATISEDDVYNFASSQKKSVSFNEKVQQQYYRINSAIIANTAKNKKKAEKKKRALERRMSEGDAGSFETINKMPASSSLDLAQLQEGWEDESHEDSGMSSSHEELLVTGENTNQVNNNNVNKPKSKRMTKKRSKHIQMANELIFDLDI